MKRATIVGIYSFGVIATTAVIKYSWELALSLYFLLAIWAIIDIKEANRELERNNQDT